MATAVQPFAGTYELDRDHSTVQFAIRHVQVSVFRGQFADVDVRLVADGDGISLEGEALVESISITQPDFRAHVVQGADFFDAGSYPRIAFRSTEVALEDGGEATVTGDLTIRGVSRRVTARGTYQPTREDPFGNQRAGLDLRATIDRRSFDLSWQLALPDGDDALGWEVEISAQLELVRQG
jgi:polyisoprenoid-binding protein YceI